jgi:NTP pyrophosphatase (non-canonical NTP hydrolase)
MNDILSIDKIYDLVSKVSQLEQSDITKKGLKLNEEVGELSAEILKLVGYKHHNDTSEEIRQHLLEEAADSLIIIFDILVIQGYTKEEIVKTCGNKINKWVDQIKNDIIKSNSK